jgi:transglutaminase/protease-like cytokinesis protein 3
MSTVSIESSPKSNSGAAKKAVGKMKSGSPPKSKMAATIGKATKIDVPQSEGRVTKQELVLSLLSRLVGASIEEIMQATNWQQHSVRGFLAGTVKKKLGFTLTSSKVAGEPRRYRIETKRSK